MQNLKRNWLVAWKITKDLINFHASSRKSENLHFDWILLSKAYKDLDEKIQTNYVSWHWRLIQNLKKKWLVVSNMTWGIWWIFNQPLKSLKTSHQWGIFVQSIWGLSLKNTEELSFITLNSDAKLNKPWPCGFKSGMRNWVNFH